jgi:hypothetical protein
MAPYVILGLETASATLRGYSDCRDISPRDRDTGCLRKQLEHRRTQADAIAPLLAHGRLRHRSRLNGFAMTNDVARPLA